MQYSTCSAWSRNLSTMQSKHSLALNARKSLSVNVSLPTLAVASSVHACATATTTSFVSLPQCAKLAQVSCSHACATAATPSSVRMWQYEKLTEVSLRHACPTATRPASVGPQLLKLTEVSCGHACAKVRLRVPPRQARAQRGRKPLGRCPLHVRCYRCARVPGCNVPVVVWFRHSCIVTSVVL